MVRTVRQQHIDLFDLISQDEETSHELPVVQGSAYFLAAVLAISYYTTLNQPDSHKMVLLTSIISLHSWFTHWPVFA